MSNNISKTINPSHLIDVRALADKANIDAEKLRTGGEFLFGKMADNELDLADAIADAFSSSGLNEDQTRELIAVLAEDFAKPLPEPGAAWVDQLTSAGENAREQVGHLAENVKEKLADIDLQDAKEKGLAMGNKIVGQASDAIGRAREKFGKK
jgi:hypothetical protein